MEQYLELGKINNTHGLKGEVKFDYWCDGIEYLQQLKKVYLDSSGTKALTLLSARAQKRIAILKFAEIASIAQAEELKGRILYCNRDDAVIDEDAFYLADVIGCRIVDADTDEAYGTITDVVNYGSCDIYEAERGGKRVLVPATPDIIVAVDTAHGTVRIRPMKGLFDEN